MGNKERISRALFGDTVFFGSVLGRYHWVPSSVWDFICATNLVVAPDQQSWFLTGRDYCGQSNSAFTWDEWEVQSLEAAAGDDEWCGDIKHFWDTHLPLAASVRDGYEFLALERDGLCVVVGAAPDFEDVSRMAASVGDLFQMIVSRDQSLGSWK